jgi:hypothetical protein
MKAFRWNRNWSILGALVTVAVVANFPRGRPAPSGVRVSTAAEWEEAIKSDPFVVYRGTNADFHRFSAIDGRAFSVPVGELTIPAPFPISDGMTLHPAIHNGMAGPPDARRVDAWTRGVARSKPGSPQTRSGAPPSK